MENDAAEIGLSDGCSDQRVQDVCNQRGDDGVEGCAQNYGNCKVDDVTAQDKIAKSFEHVSLRAISGSTDGLCGGRKLSEAECCRLSTLPCYTGEWQGCSEVLRDSLREPSLRG